MSAMAVNDRYEQIATDKLWALLPEVYRTEDSAVLDQPGPLYELAQRLAVQVAVVRRSLDRLWEDQSIEACEDWLIPYIGALVDTNLVPAMDARGQRLDVANTINYRRRKGTLGLVEQLAADVTGWESRAVEFFRALARRRHGLDPPIGRPADSADPAGARRLQLAEGLVGLLTGTPMGGYADLRNAAGAQDANTAFDEFHHRLDVRRGEGALGWYGIPKIGVFEWRSVSIGVDRATPVKVSGCEEHYAFDPTGRQIALFAVDDRPAASFGESWRPLAEWQVPGPITQLLYDAVALADAIPPVSGGWPDPTASLYPASLSVTPTGAGVPLDADTVEVWPEVGRFKLLPAVAGEDVEVGYHYGLPADIGAGPYDRRQACVATPPDPAPVTSVPGGSDIALRDALGAIAGSGTVIVTDGLTSTSVADVGGATPIGQVTVRAADEGRAVIVPKQPAAPWTFTGDPPGPGDATAELRLEGVLLSGTDIVLSGRFAEVTISCCTLDPGTSGDLRVPPVIWEPAVDLRPLSPTRLWIEGEVKQLTVERSITGPIRARQGGFVETLSIADSIIQGLPASDGTLLAAEEVYDPDGLFSLLRHKRDPLTRWIAGHLSSAAKTAVRSHGDGTPVASADLDALVADLNTVIQGPSIYTTKRFADRRLTAAVRRTADSGATGEDLVRLNRRLLDEAFGVELHDAAIAVADGLTQLVRTTVLGWGYVHRLECSESILDEPVVAVDDQDGCVRFSAWATGSSIPRKYESVRIAARAPIFLTRRFGEWAYGQLSGDADSAILAASTAGTPSIRSGSHDGSEMGAYCAQGTSVKERSLQIKLDEFLPVGLTAVQIPMPPFDAEAETKRGRPWPPT
jgi:hypothetical protein